jgi:hypothetical protein
VDGGGWELFVSCICFDNSCPTTHRDTPPFSHDPLKPNANKQHKRYRTLPRQSRYAQHRLRVLGRAIELLAISRPSRTAEQQRDLDEALRGLKL